MKIIDPSYHIMTDFRGLPMLKHLELAGRVCYKSEDCITDDSARKFTKMIKTNKHESVLEHCSVTVRFICNRGFSHELVRHRIASYSQESSRYVSYAKSKHGAGISVIRPPMWSRFTQEQQDIWIKAMQNSEDSYLAAVSSGMKAQEARGVLPIDVKTEIICTANLRSWINIFNLRCANSAHPSMRQLMIPLREEFAKELPEIFGVTP